MPEVLESLSPAERNLRSMSLDAKAGLRRNGYKGNLDTLPPSSDEGILRAYPDSLCRLTQGRQGMVEYAGDPRVWGQAYMPPVRKLLERTTRMPDDTEAMWEQRKQTLLTNRARQADAAAMGIKTTADTGATYTLADAKRILDKGK